MSVSKTDLVAVGVVAVVGVVDGVSAAVEVMLIGDYSSMTDYLVPLHHGVMPLHHEDKGKKDHLVQVTLALLLGLQTYL